MDNFKCEMENNNGVNNGNVNNNGISASNGNVNNTAQGNVNPKGGNSIGQENNAPFNYNDILDANKRARILGEYDRTADRLNVLVKYDIRDHIRNNSLVSDLETVKDYI